jgi:outer membrane protein assembly factor BamB
MLRKISFALIIICSFLTLSLLQSCQSVQKGTGDKLSSGWGNDKNVRWTHDITGKGWSSPVVSGNKVFYTSAINETNPSAVEEEMEQPPQDEPKPPTPPLPQPQPQPQGPPPEHKEDTTYKSEVYRLEITCLDLKTGEVLWNKVAWKGNPRTNSHRGNGYASETPVTDGKYVYAYFGMTGIYCYDMKGNLIWQKDLGAYKTQNGWGTGSSPVLYKDLIYLQIDNEVNSFLVALNAGTGEEKWRVARNEKTNYSTPVIWTNKNRTELIAGGKTSRSYDPETGKLLWEMKMIGAMSIPTAVCDKEHLYIGNAGESDSVGSLYSVKAGSNGNITPEKGKLVSEGVEWVLPAAGTGNPSPVLYKGMIYILDSSGKNFSCFDAATGKTVYTQKLEKVAGCWATPRVYKDNLYITDERGVTTLVKTGEKFEVIAQYRLSDKIWASTAITDGAFIFKGAKKVWCINI